MKFNHRGKRLVRSVAVLALAVAPVIFITVGGGVAGAATQDANDETSLRHGFGDPNVDVVNVTADIAVDGCSPGSVSRDTSNPVVVEGNGHTITRDNTDCDKRIFKSDGDVTVQNITLTGGRAHGPGGAIKSHGNVIVTNSTITDNQALWCNQVASAASDDEVDATFYCHPYGGGVFADGSVTVTGSTFSNNLADDTGGGFASGGHASVSGSTFENNVAGGDPEAAADALAALSSEGCLCSGGGFAATEFNADVTNSTFLNNSVSCAECGGKGGGIYVQGSLTLTGSTVSSNTVSCEECGGQGGGTYSGASTTSDHSTVSDNSSSCDFCGGAGGGIYAGSQLLDNYDQMSSTQGVGAFVQEINGRGSLVISYSNIDGNSTDCDSCNGGGGGAYADSPETVTVNNSTLSNNTAAWSGGALATGAEEGEGVAAVITNSTVTGNVSHYGAAITIWEKGDSLQLIYDTIDNNTLDLRELATGDVQTRAVNDEEPAANVAATTLRSFGTDVTHPDGGLNCYVWDGASSDGYNFSDDDTCGFDEATDSTSSSNDPMLGALGDNGGATPTMLPQVGSPLIDNIALADCGFNDVAIDQRDVSRPQIHGCDTGAVEVRGAIVNVNKVVTGTLGNPVPAPGYSFTVSCTDGSTATLAVADATAGGLSDSLGDILPGSTCTVSEAPVAYTNSAVVTQPTVAYDPSTPPVLAEGQTETVTVTNDYSLVNLLGIAVNATPKFTG